MRKIYGLILLLIPVLIFAQEEKKFGIEFHGFVKNDVYFDSRQTVDVRDGHFLLYPKNEELDFNGDDINATPKFNMLTIQSRLKGVISGPDAFGAKTSGVIEGAFFGNIGSDINGFRLRHAFVKLSWDNVEFLAGQFWHPMFVTSNFPGTVSFNTGTPFQPFSRNPQLRFTYKAGHVNVIATAMHQVDFKDSGPLGGSTQYIRNNVFPELNLRVEYKSDNILIGAGVNYKSLMPRISIVSPGIKDDSLELVSADRVQKTDTRVAGSSFFAYGHFTGDGITVKLYGIKGQMLYGMTNLGGYAESNLIKENYEVDFGNGIVVPNQMTTEIKYTPINTNSVWADIILKINKNMSFGLFSGYSQNAGANDTIKGANYSRGKDIAHLYRVSPRLIYNANKFRIAPEVEYTVAGYGTPDDFGVVNNPVEVANIRFLVGLYYFF